MRKLIAIALACAVCSCQGWKQTAKHVESNWVGLNRVIILYTGDGKVIKSWQGRFSVEMHGCMARFIDNDGHTVTISGTFTIEEQ